VKVGKGVKVGRGVGVLGGRRVEVGREVEVGGLGLGDGRLVGAAAEQAARENAIRKTSSTRPLFFMDPFYLKQGYC
jgi:hypothetical protein